LKFRYGVKIAMVMASLPALCQDRRTITEPKIPASCTVLRAALRDTDNTLAEADEQRPDTVRIQKAIDGCAAGKAVELKADVDHNAFLSGPLEMREGVTLLVDDGVTLYASRNPADFDNMPGSCGIMGSDSRPCKPLIGIHGVHHVAVMGGGTIDGRGGQIVMGKPYTWWQLSRAAAPSNARYSAPRLIVADHADDLVLYRIRLHNSPNFHVTVSHTDGFTAWDIHLQTPTAKGVDARNTDGIDPGSSENITVTRSWIDSGDDNIAIKTGTHHMSVVDNHFYRGHGMSIGSETNTSVGEIVVDQLTLDGTTSGIRIKSNVQRGGPVRNIMYRHLCMRNVNSPISISPFYTGRSKDEIEGSSLKGDLIPDYKDVHLEDIHSVTAGTIQVVGLNAAHLTQLFLDGVQVDSIAPDQVRARFADLTVGTKGTNLSFAGEGVTVRTAPGAHVEVSSCKDVFVPFQN
jgi:polygalacturonase